MSNKIKATAASLTLLLAACGGSSSPTPQATPQSGEAAGGRATVPSNVPANAAFVGRVWVSITPGHALGSILVFLPDGTLLMDSCFETFRLSQWGVAGERIRWLEDTIPIEAEVSLHGKDELRLHVPGQEREQTYIAASVPYVCPDLPR